MTLNPPTILFDSFNRDRFPSSWRFGGYVNTIVAAHPDEVFDVLKQVEWATADGMYAAGFVAYEAASALNPDLPSVSPAEGLPLAWFAIFRERHCVEAGAEPPFSSTDVSLEPLKSITQYTGDIERIRDYIASGDSYQINHTFPMQGGFQGDLGELYRHLGTSQQAPFGAYLDTGRYKILSASPELFFLLKDGTITTRPMKGTASRGRWSAEDRDTALQLLSSPKERAENLMIVDLLRNDLGIVAETGSVTVDVLFEVETYPTVHQMTSTVSAQLRPGTSLTDIFKALFPCGSVTGAPKRRSMEIISELENTPRGVYCGAIGCVAPGGEALFSVAIRTMLFDAYTHKLTMGVGSAVTWDSEPAAEYDECISKAAFINQPGHNFTLIESLRLENGVYTLPAKHIDRLTASARYFNFRCDRVQVRHDLTCYATQTPGLCKVRLMLSADGGIDISSELLLENDDILCAAVSSITVDSRNCMRYHKTSCRDLFNAARAEQPDYDEVLFLNECGQLTEGSYHNLVVKLEGQFVTPPLSCGLLPGVFRERLLEREEIIEQILYPGDLKRADEIWLINSVRGWRRCIVV